MIDIFLPLLRAFGRGETGNYNALLICFTFIHSSWSHGFIYCGIKAGKSKP